MDGWSIRRLNRLNNIIIRFILIYFLYLHINVEAIDDGLFNFFVSLHMNVEAIDVEAIDGAYILHGARMG
jgi:hypothetical protein